MDKSPEANPYNGWGHSKSDSSGGKPEGTGKPITRKKAAKRALSILNKMLAKEETSVQEDAPTNAAGNGSVAGIGVGTQGEPGVKKKKYQQKNAAEAPSPVMSTSPLKRMFDNYTKGK